MLTFLCYFPSKITFSRPKCCQHVVDTVETDMCTYIEMSKGNISALTIFVTSRVVILNSQTRDFAAMIRHYILLSLSDIYFRSLWRKCFVDASEWAPQTRQEIMDRWHPLSLQIKFHQEIILDIVPNALFVEYLARITVLLGNRMQQTDHDSWQYDFFLACEIL